MRVAITSFVKSENYGALLQSFALQNTLEKYGHSVVYLNYTRKTHFTLFQYLKNILYRVIRLFFGYGVRKRRTAKFQKDFIHVENYKGENAYDIFISGSDQVWHPDLVNDFFFLNFVTNTKKISYASSFGVSQINKNSVDFYRSSLEKFSYISVRESTGRTIINELGIKRCDVVIDPTLLLTKDEWSVYFKDLSCPKFKYILCYIMSGDRVMSKYIRELSNSLNRSFENRYKVITIGDKEYLSILPEYNLECKAGPLEFVSYIKNADYVITSSFHGTCFSINFNKPFISVMRVGNKVNGRIEELLSLLSLEKCMHYSNEEVTSIGFENIDYESTNYRLNKERVRCLDALKKMIHHETITD